VRVADLGPQEVAARLSGRGLALDLGPVRARVRADHASLAEAIRLVYGEYSDGPIGGVFEVTASVEQVGGWRRFLRPQLNFVVDGEAPFEPFPADTHLPLLEWGLNWCIASRCNQFLLLHAGAVERGGRAVLLPAQPGSGKSTLAAALACSGFRLLSDEFGVVSLDDGLLLPLVRPIALKNESIDVIRRFAPGAVIGPSFPRTRKGTVAHLAPNRLSVDDSKVPVRPWVIVFPKFVAGEPCTLEPVPSARAFMKLAGNAFNYDLLGPAAFDAVHGLVAESRCYRLRYGELAEAVSTVGRLLCD
jgi:HprK-related kinase A